MKESNETQIAACGNKENQKSEDHAKNRTFKALAIGATAVVAVGISAILCLKFGFKIDDLRATNTKKSVGDIASKSFEAAVQFPISDEPNVVARATRTVNVNQHIRKLHDGCKASPDAIDRARALGIELAENKTLVRPHSRTYSTAA